MIRISIALWLLVGSPAAFAYPGMIRQGYVNCTACHVSPSGGGVLNEYGRELSGELLSARAKPGESAFLYGAFATKLPETLLLGGDTRLMSIYRDNPVYREKRLFLMQSDIEGAYRMGKFTLDLEAGYLDSGDFQTLRHYLMYQVDEADAVRAGKFRNNYGINTDEHQLTIKNNLGWTDETETYNVEYSRLTGAYSLYATALFGAPESVDQRKGLSIGRTGVADHGGSVKASAFVADKFEIGASYFYGRKLGSDWRTVTGPFVTLGFTPRFFYLGELDFQNQNKWGVFDFQRLTYEVVQGLQLFVSQELASSNLPGGGMNSRLLRYGVGALFFPRPHFELDMRLNEQEDSYGENGFHPVAWLMLHFYL
jgi:hypothetical protein